jgi:hypothetical protein
MFFNLLNSIICGMFVMYKKLSQPPDYHISKEELEYVIDHRRKYLIDDAFWELESRGWNRTMREYYANATGHKFRNTCIPQNIKKIILRTSYWYNNKPYKFISYNINKKLPKVEKLKFSIPLHKVELIDNEDKPVRDITEKIRRYAGPQNDFHGEDVLIRDMLYFAADVLKNEYPKLKITNIVGNTKVIDTLKGTTSDLLVS